MDRFEVVGRTNQTSEWRGVRFVDGFWRVRSVVAALLVASAGIGFLVAALVLGSIFAFLLLVLVVLVISMGLARAAICRITKILISSHRQQSPTPRGPSGPR